MFRKTSLLGAVLCFSLIGCGGGSSDPEPTNGDTGTQSENTDDNVSNTPTLLTGVFVDSAVEGASYSTPTQSGTTNSVGQFNYIAGEQVTFSVGDAQLPTITAAPLISPVEMAAGSANPTATTTNIARLLQSLDTDGNPDNGITISPSAAANAVAINFNVSEDQFSNDTNVINLVANSGSVTTTLVSAADAIAHLNDTLGTTDQDNIQGESGNAEQFSVDSLYRRYLIPVQENFSNGWTAYRFNERNNLSIADIGDNDGILRYGDFPWSVRDGGTLVADFSQLNPPSECSYNLQSVSSEIASVTAQCTNLDEAFDGLYHLSKPLSPSDLEGIMWTLDNGDILQLQSNGTGVQTSDSASRPVTYQASSMQAVDIYRDGLDRIELVLVQGTLQDGILVAWEFNQDNRMTAISFFNTSSSNLNVTRFVR